MVAAGSHSSHSFRCHWRRPVSVIPNAARWVGQQTPSKSVSQLESHSNASVHQVRSKYITVPCNHMRFQIKIRWNWHTLGRFWRSLRPQIEIPLFRKLPDGWRASGWKATSGERWRGGRIEEDKDTGRGVRWVVSCWEISTEHQKSFPTRSLRRVVLYNLSSVHT